MKNKKLLLIALINLFCLFDKANAQAPYIGSDSSFALFTSAGAFGNTGNTIIWGDVGTHVGLYTGSQTVIGNVHVADAFSSKASQDLQTAYTYTSGLTCDSTITTPFGNGLVLVSGRVYCFTTATSLNGDVILDANGDPDGIFIFKINGALTTNQGSNVILKNAASFCNVYWQVGGAVDLGKNSTFKGTILADGAISLLDSATLDGRGLTRAGAISLNNNRVIGCDALGLPLPVLFADFRAQRVGLTIQLNWSTALEIENDFFTVERSKDAINFREVIQVKGSGNSNFLQHYVAFDQQPPSGMVFYRIKQTDFDGKSFYSDVVVVHIDKSSPFTIYPNPFSTSISIVLDDISQKMNNCELMIYNVLGEEITNTTLTKRLTTITTANRYSGMYFYKIICDNKTVQSGRIFSN